ncbi:hypothetical protein RHGRI_018457 [Rhododendron griersonianum]|uniref:IST1-like protein n=1 Tax=Rhododendron griersonianum TaxID=479676 RepID=A0AAV6K1H3_9ERIC|nr:hypothetical protein RHGRI_018457 [Rhododendron griersonianum]
MFSENLITQARSQLYTQKVRREAITRQSTADIAQLLMSGEYEGAIARVDQHHQNECLLSAYGQIEKFCETVHTNINEISSRRRLTYEVVEAVSSLVFAASKCGELLALQQIRVLVKKHFGADFEKTSVKLQQGNYVNTKIKYNLGNKSLSDDEKVEIISQIARECKIPLNLKPDQVSVDKPVPQYESLENNGEDQREASKTKAKFSKIGLKFSVFGPGSLMRMCTGNNDLPQGRDASIKTDRAYGKLDGSGRKNKMNDQTMLKKLGLSRPKTHSRRGLLRNEDSDSQSNNAHPNLPDYDVLVATFSEYKESNTNDRTTRKEKGRF